MDTVVEVSPSTMRDTSMADQVAAAEGELAAAKERYNLSRFGTIGFDAYKDFILNAPKGAY